MDRQQRGAAGEQAAAQHYKDDGYNILRRNYRTRQGEVDIIAQRDGVLVFAEVKTRGQGTIARPAEWVDVRKQRRISLAAMHYLQQHGLGDVAARFDVVEVLADATGKLRVNRIENAFDVFGL